MFTFPRTGVGSELEEKIMRRRGLLALGTLWLSLLSFSCSSGSVPQNDEGSIASPIVNGSPDNGAHPAVMAFFHILDPATGEGSVCSGTVVAVKPPYGFLLL